MGFGDMTAEEKKLKADERMRSLQNSLANSPKQIQEFYKHVPKATSRLYLEVHCGKGGKTDRLKLKCLDCCCWQRDEVRLCTVRQCALWEIRPYK